MQIQRNEEIVVKQGEISIEYQSDTNQVWFYHTTNLTSSYEKEDIDTLIDLLKALKQELNDERLR